MKRLIYIALLAGMVVMASSCGKNWLTSLANNPNAPSQAPVQLLLPPVLSSYGAAISDGYQSVGDWMGSLTISGSYAVDANTATYYLSYTDGDWDYWAGQLKNLQYIITTAGAEANMENFVAAAMTLKAFGYQYLVDSYGQAPYTNAFKGSQDFFPTYDGGQAIYDSCIDLLDKAIAIFTGPGAGPSAITLGTNDILFQGNVADWAAFANTLKLRFLIRESKIISSSDAEAEISKTASAGYLTSDALVNPGYLNTAGKQSPLWSTYGISPGGTSLYSDGFKYQFAGGAMVNFYKTYNDPRLFYVYCPDGLTPLSSSYGTVDTNPGHYDAAYYGDRVTAAALVNTGNGSAGIGHAILSSYNQPPYLISAAESYFLQAEAVERGWIQGGDAAAGNLFDEGITASFNQLGVFANTIGADSAAEAYYTQGKALADWSATPANQKIEAIIVQKWAASAITDHYEQWVEYRRTGFPGTDILPLSKYPGNSRHIPNRYKFPKSESQSNQKAYNTAVASGDDPQSSTIFWQ